MNHDVPHSPAQRRAALIALCARQRLDAAHEVRELLAPISAGWRLKVPLAIAGAVLGIIAARSGRAAPMIKRLVPMITTGLSLWKLVRSMLPMRRAARAG